MAQWVLDKVNGRVRGIFYITIGVILLLHTLDFFRAYLNIFLVIASIVLIAYGAFELNAFKEIKKAIENMTNDDKTSSK